jgi:hypothetical protein
MVMTVELTKLEVRAVERCLSAVSSDTLRSEIERQIVLAMKIRTEGRSWGYYLEFHDIPKNNRIDKNRLAGLRLSVTAKHPDQRNKSIS